MNALMIGSDERYSSANFVSQGGVKTCMTNPNFSAATWPLVH
jgi:hypothetical protein